MEKSKILLIIFGSILILSNIFFIVEFVLDKAEISTMKKVVKDQKTNEKVLTFTKFFVEKVLQGNAEVSFDDRLKLENDVRDINDPVIFSQWQAFVNSKTDTETQKAVGILFKTLLNKIAN